MDSAKNSNKCLTLLSQLLLEATDLSLVDPARNARISTIVSTFTAEDFDELWSLANSHHVIARTFPRLHQAMVAARHERAEWVNQAIIKERERIQHALSFLAPICDALKGSRRRDRDQVSRSLA